VTDTLGITCSTHGFVRVQKLDIDAQLRGSPYSSWRCPICSRPSKFEGRELKTFSTKPFSFADSRVPCTYWGNAEHIVADGACRCGRAFRIVEMA
jgi:hypothetical protein